MGPQPVRLPEFQSSRNFCHSHAKTNIEFEVYIIHGVMLFVSKCLYQLLALATKSGLAHYLQQLLLLRPKLLYEISSFVGARGKS